MKTSQWMLLLCLVAGGCTEAAQGQTQDQADPLAQRGDGRPYEILGSQVWDVPDPVSGRQY